jgi:hypothetical protein
MAEGKQEDTVYDEARLLVGRRVQSVTLTQEHGNDLLRIKTLVGSYLKISAKGITLTKHFSDLLEGHVVEEVYWNPLMQRLSLRQSEGRILLHVEFQDENSVAAEWVCATYSAPRMFSHYDSDVSSIAKALIGVSVDKVDMGEDTIAIHFVDNSGENGALTITDVNDGHEPVTWVRYHKVYQERIIIHDVSIAQQSSWVSSTGENQGTAILEAVDDCGDPCLDIYLATIAEGKKRMPLVVMQEN